MYFILNKKKNDHTIRVELQSTSKSRSIVILSTTSTSDLKFKYFLTFLDDNFEGSYRISTRVNGARSCEESRLSPVTVNRRRSRVDSSRLGQRVKRTISYSRVVCVCGDVPKTILFRSTVKNTSTNIILVCNLRYDDELRRVIRASHGRTVIIIYRYYHAMGRRINY